MSSTLTAKEIARQSHDLCVWDTDEGRSRRSVALPDFPMAIEVAGAVADVAEQRGDIRPMTVTFVLSTHSVGAATQPDVELAHRISAIAASLIP